MTLFDPSIDYLGKWFTVRRSLGIEDTIVVGLADVPSQTVEWFDYAHAERDGIGALAHFLEKQGYGFQNMPVHRFPAPASFAERFRLALNPYGTEKPRSTHWRTYNEQATGASTLAWQVLTPEQSQQIDANVKDLNVSLNSYFFWRLNQLISPLIQGNDPVSWFFAVNLRGPFQKHDPESNHSSGIYFNIDHDSDASHIQAKISTQLKRQSHWGLAYQAHIGALLGSRFMRYILSQTKKRSRFAGSLSMLGDWPTNVSHNGLDPNKAVLICAPGSPMYPVATGVMLWRDRYTMCLRLNPALEISQSETEAMLQQWISLLVAHHSKVNGQ